MKVSRFSESQIISILKQAESGYPISDLCREHGMSSATFYKWRSKYGGMDTSLLNRVKELEAENARLKKMVAEERLNTEILKDVLGKKGVKPSQRREMVQDIVGRYPISARKACSLMCISRTCYYYQSKAVQENEQIADLLLELTGKNRTWGFCLCFLYMRNVLQKQWSHKRPYRVYKELSLNLRIKPRTRLVRSKPEPLAVA